MYLLLEHNGTKEHVHRANEIQNILESDWGATVEQVVGNNEVTIKVYSEDFKKIVELAPNDNLDVLSFYIKNYYEDEL